MAGRVGRVLVGADLEGPMHHCDHGSKSPAPSPTHGRLVRVVLEASPVAVVESSYAGAAAQIPSKFYKRGTR